MPEPCIHAGRVGHEHRPIGRGESGENGARDGPEAEDARTPVLIERRRAHELGELPGSEPPGQVHLEEAVLRMSKAGAEGEVGPARRAHRHDAEAIALEQHRGSGAGHDDAPVEHGQRGTQQQVQCRQQREQRQRGGERDARERASHEDSGLTITFRICIELVPPSTPECSPLVRMSRSPSCTRDSSSSRAKMLLKSPSTLRALVESNTTG